MHPDLAQNYITLCAISYDGAPHRRSFAHWESRFKIAKVIRPNHVSGLSRINVLECHKRCTGQKALPFPPFGSLEKAFLFLLAEEAGTYVTTTRSRNDDTTDEL